MVQPEQVTDHERVTTAGASWAALVEAIGPISLEHSEQNAHRMMALVDELLEGDRSGPGVESLLAFVTEWVEQYEASHVHIRAVDPVELLRHLMEVNGLKQQDLASDFGGQSAVSAVLSGRRLISRRTAFSLGKRFKISAAAFLEGGHEHENKPPSNEWSQDLISSAGASLQVASNVYEISHEITHYAQSAMISISHPVNSGKGWIIAGLQSADHSYSAKHGDIVLPTSSSTATRDTALQVSRLEDLHRAGGDRSVFQATHVNAKILERHLLLEGGL